MQAFLGAKPRMTCKPLGIGVFLDSGSFPASDTVVYSFQFFFILSKIMTFRIGHNT